jgi:predicted nucleic acid-binding protein
VIRTFLDAGVLIAAARGRGMIARRAHAILDDAERSFVTSEYIRMGVLPKALYYRQNTEVLLYE